MFQLEKGLHSQHDMAESGVLCGRHYQGFTGYGPLFSYEKGNGEN